MDMVYENKSLRLQLKVQYGEILDPKGQFTEFNLYTHRTMIVGPTKLPNPKDGHFTIRVPRFNLSQEESQVIISDLISQAEPFDRSSTELVKEILENYHREVAYQSLYVPIGTVRISADLKIDVVHPSLHITMKRIHFKTEDRDKSCSVCLENFEPDSFIYKMPCQHVFHPKCICEWRDRNKTCPICRYDF